MSMVVAVAPVLFSAVKAVGPALISRASAVAVVASEVNVVFAPFTSISPVPVKAMAPDKVPALVKARTLVPLPPLTVVAVARVGVAIVVVTPLAMSMVVAVAPVLFSVVKVTLASTSSATVPEITTEFMTGVPPATILSVLPPPSRMRLETVVSLSVPPATEVTVRVLAAAVVAKSKPAVAKSPTIASAPVPEKVMAPVALAKMIVRVSEKVIPAPACDMMMPVQLMISAESTRMVLASSMVIVPVPAPKASLVLMLAALSAPPSVPVTQLSP